MMLRVMGNIVALLIAALAVLVEMWVLVPAPTIGTLAVAVVAPEMAAWTIPAIVLLALIATAIARGLPRLIAQLTCAFAVGCAGIPFVLVPHTLAVANGAMTAALGDHWDVAASDRIRARLQQTPFSLRDAFAPADDETPIATMRDVPVPVLDGTLALDVYRPSDDALHPALIAVYGGAWIFGTRADLRAFAEGYARHGYVVIVVDYRHAPQYRFPTQPSDVKAALAVTADHLAAWHIDADRIAILGRSAGAELALLAAYDPDSPLHVRAAIGEYTPADLVGGYTDPPQPDPANVRRILDAYLGGPPASAPAAYRAASPLDLVRPGLPPTLLITGDRDELVQPRFQRALADALAVHGDRVASIELPWSNHAFDTIPNGIGGQIAHYYIERFLAATL